MSNLPLAPGQSLETVLIPDTPPTRMGRFNIRSSIHSFQESLIGGSEHCPYDRYDLKRASAQKQFIALRNNAL